MAVRRARGSDSAAESNCLVHVFAGRPNKMAATTLNAVAMTAMAINLSASDHFLDSAGA
jgi:hypothetical protein